LRVIWASNNDPAQGLHALKSGSVVGQVVALALAAVVKLL